MAKIHIDRLMKQYGIPKDGLTGIPHEFVITTILRNNNENISRRIGELNKEHWEKSLKKITSKEKQFIIPDVSDVLPKKSIFILKAAESGKQISETLRNDLTSKLRQSLTQFTPTTNESTYIRRREVGAGKINPKLINEFQNNIRGVFENYVSKGEYEKVPPNIRNIAVTEMRSSISSINRSYMSKLMEKNPELIVRKQWIQNKSLSHEFRHSHNAVNGQTINIDEMFRIPLYEKKGNKWVKTGNTVLASGPYDDTLPASETIGCSCDLRYIAQRKDV